MSKRLTKIAGLGLALGLAFGATQANATATLSYSLVQGENQKGDLHSNPPSSSGVSSYNYTGINMGPFALTITDDATHVVSNVNSFCVDITHGLVNNSDGWAVTEGLSGISPVLSGTRADQLTRLLSIADQFIADGLGYSGTGTAADRGTAVQIAIWEIINEATQDTSTTGAANNYNLSGGTFQISNLPSSSVAIADANGLLTNLQRITVPTNFKVALVSAQNNQTQVVYGNSALRLLSAAPEPATWGMMVIGFGVIGASLRRKRTVAGAIA